MKSIMCLERPVRFGVLVRPKIIRRICVAHALDDRNVSPPNVRTAGQGLAETLVDADHTRNRLRGLGVS